MIFLNLPFTDEDEQIWEKIKELKQKLQLETDGKKKKEIEKQIKEIEKNCELLTNKVRITDHKILVDGIFEINKQIADLLELMEPKKKEEATFKFVDFITSTYQILSGLFHILSITCEKGFDCQDW